MLPPTGRVLKKTPCGLTFRFVSLESAARQRRVVSRTRLFGTLTGMVFLVNLARVVYAPLVEPLQGALQVGPGAIGGVVTLVWVGSALPRVPTGYLLTKVPRHRVVMGTGVVLTLAGAFAATADSLFTLGAGALLMGVASGAYFVSANPLISELYPQRVGRVMGVHGMASQLAAVGAAPLVGFALGAFTWRSVFVAIAAGAAVVTTVMTVVARRTDLPDASGVDRNLLEAVRAQWRIVLTGIAILGTTGFVWQGVFNFYVSFLLSESVPTAAARNLLTLTFAAGVPAFLVSGRLVDRLPRVPYILGVMALFVGGLFALTTASGVLGFAVVSAFLGLVIHSLFPALDAYLLGSLPDEHRGGAYAVYSGGMMLTQATGSGAVGTLVAADLGYVAIFRGLAALLTVVLVALAALWRAGRLPATGEPA
jgi:DHA1 family inner membrane transport protein